MYFISYDLGTGGVKASLFTQDLKTLSKVFIPYATYYPVPGCHEQRPEDWWSAVCESSHRLLDQAGIAATEIGCVALSGHSLVTIPVDAEKNILLEQVPIWSDTRAGKQAEAFFQSVDEEAWYMKTGNGFPPACYSIFKLMWLKETQPELFARIDKVLGSKDYINFRFTGEIYTDHSYASGLGAYNLKQGCLDAGLLNAAGLDGDIFPPIVPSHHIIGEVTDQAAAQCGLVPGTPVACGGVDNACMALGAVGAEQGRVYVSLGSSSWIPINSDRPVLDGKRRPYVFAHIQEGMYTSACSIFAGGSSLQWIRDQLCSELTSDAYAIMDQWASQAPLGANGVIFNPSLAGGTRQDKSVNIKGAFVGMHLGTTRADMIRAGLEGIALNLKLSLEILREQVEVSDRFLFCGGGSKSKIWMQMFADIFNAQVIKTNIDQDAAALGAAAICARATGCWTDYTGIPALHQVQHTFCPDPERVQSYQRLLKQFIHVNNVLADLGDYMSAEQ